jgi:LacI family transcriptional regulator
MRAFQDRGLNVPGEVPIVGFDDIQAASFQNPRLTTVRQPMKQMGEIAATVLLRRIAVPSAPVKDIHLQPELVIRESTGQVCRRSIAV